MAVEPGWIAKAFSMLFGFVGRMRRRHHAQRWTGQWEAYYVIGRDVGGPMAGAGPATVSLSPWWKLSEQLTFACYDCDEKGQPTRHQTGHIQIDRDDPNAATRRGHYLDSTELYEQQLRIRDKDTIIIMPVVGHSTLGDTYAKHAWRRKR
jgi:hypothetical protein